MRKGLKMLLLIVGVTMLVGVLGVGIAAAADPTPTPGKSTTAATDYQQVYLDKLAKLLGIDTERLTNAMTQAKTETQNQMIDAAVADGRMTQEYADWLKARPQQDGDRFDLGFGGHGGRGMRGGMQKITPSAPSL
jgi:hypothetical protein